MACVFRQNMSHPLASVSTTPGQRSRHLLDGAAPATFCCVARLTPVAAASTRFCLLAFCSHAPLSSAAGCLPCACSCSSWPSAGAGCLALGLLLVDSCCYKVKDYYVWLLDFGLVVLFHHHTPLKKKSERKKRAKKRQKKNVLVEYACPLMPAAS